MDELAVFLEDALDTTKSLSERLKSLEASLSYLERERLSTTTALTYQSSPAKTTSDAEYVLKEVILKGPDILTEKVEAALQQTPEFASAEFHGGLLEAAKSQNNFHIVRNGTLSITVIVDMDSTAGSLEHYAQAVEAYRDTIGADSKNAARASSYWKNMIYGGSMRIKYSETIKARLDLAGGLAPYWKLLDKGNIPMSSDWGGKAYPDNAPTDFTLKTSKEMENLYRKFMKDVQLLTKESISKLKARLLKIREMKTKIEKFLDDLANSSFEKGIEVFIKKYGENLSVVRLTAVVEKVMRGEEVKIATRGRLELTAKGAEKRIRPSLFSIIKTFGLE